MGGANGDHRRAVKKQGERVRVGRGPEGQASVRETLAGSDGRDAENPPVGGEMTEREVRQSIKGVSPGKAGAERVQEGVESRRILTRWRVPKYARDWERVRIHRDQGRRSRGREAEQVLMQGHALFEAPFPDRREGGGAMGK